MQQIVLELKIQQKGKAATLAQGLEQIARYAEQCGADAQDGAHLLIIDRDPQTSWGSKTYSEQHSKDGRCVQVWGM